MDLRLYLFKVTVAAIALPSRSDDLVDLTAKVATVSGYGFTANGGPVSNCLMYTTLSIINNAVVSFMETKSISYLDMTTRGYFAIFVNTRSHIFSVHKHTTSSIRTIFVQQELSNIK